MNEKIGLGFERSIIQLSSSKFELCLHYLLYNFVRIVTKQKWLSLLVILLQADKLGEVL